MVGPPASRLPRIPIGMPPSPAPPSSWTYPEGEAPGASFWSSGDGWFQAEGPHSGPSLLSPALPPASWEQWQQISRLALIRGGGGRRREATFPWVPPVFQTLEMHYLITFSPLPGEAGAVVITLMPQLRTEAQRGKLTYLKEPSSEVASGAVNKGIAEAQSHVVVTILTRKFFFF